MSDRDDRAAPVVPIGAGRSLKTAAEALATLRILGASPGGLTAEALAGELGKSTATARYLLNTLCQEGYAVKEGAAGLHHLVATPPWGTTWGESDPLQRYELPARLSDAVTELYARTRQRSYLAQWQDDETVIVDARGHQGLARIPDLAERIPLAQAHALAVTKMLVASSSELDELLREHSDLTAFTPTTLTTTPQLDLELATVRRDGVAVDREEFVEGFCCVSAPILAPDGVVAASIAVSTPTRRFTQCREEITRAVSEVAAEASRAWREHDGPDDEEDVACGATAVPDPRPVRAAFSPASSAAPDSAATPDSSAAPDSAAARPRRAAAAPVHSAPGPADREVGVGVGPSGDRR